MRRIDVIVTMSPMHKQPLSVPEWEIPFLQRIHGQVDIVGESHCDLRVPDPRDEYTRLAKRYGKDKETLVPRIEQVYGSDIGGLRALTEAMAKDLLEQEELDGKAAKDAAAKQDKADKETAARTMIEEIAPTLETGKRKRGSE